MIEPDVIRGYRRKLDSMVLRASCDDPETFAVILRELERALADMARAAQLLNEDEGYSWADIARPLGVTRVAAWQRFARRDRARV